MFNSGSPSLADIAAVTDGNRNNNDGMMNGMGGWWVLIILLALFGGFGGNWGNRGNNSGNCCSDNVKIIPFPTGGLGMYGAGYGASFTDAALQRGFDTQTIISKLDGVANGICGLGYDQLAQMNNLGNTVQQTGWNLAGEVRNTRETLTQGLWNLSQQQSNCCCETQQNIKQLGYDVATQACAIKTEIANSTRDIMQNDDANFRALNDTVRDGFCRLENAQKDQYIRQLEQRLNACDRDSALQGLGSYLVGQLNPPARPAYIVQNPNGCNCNTGCCQNLSGCCA